MWAINLFNTFALAAAWRRTELFSELEPIRDPFCKQFIEIDFDFDLCDTRKQLKTAYLMIGHPCKKQLTLI
jgi:hypothetical protein